MAGTVELDEGPVDYVRTGGPGPVVVLVNAALSDETLWAGVAAELTAYDVVSLVLPLGAHRRPMSEHADLSLRGQARLLADVLEALDLREVTLCFNDWCAAQVMVAEGWTDRVARLVLVSCETAANYLPGLPGRFLGLLGRSRAGPWLGYQSMRLPLATRLPLTFGRMSDRPLPPALVRGWFGPGQRDPRIRRDLRRYVGDVPAARRCLQDAERSLGGFQQPVLVVWGEEDRVMPRAEGQTLADRFAAGRFVLVPGAGTLVPLDQPVRLASLVRDFAGSRGWDVRGGGRDESGGGPWSTHP